jgi:hypothetical protein
MGYLNTTCSAGTIGSVYRPLVGPVISDSAFKMFSFTVVGKNNNNEDLVEIKTFYPKSNRKPL